MALLAKVVAQIWIEPVVVHVPCGVTERACIELEVVERQQSLLAPVHDMSRLAFDRVQLTALVHANHLAAKVTFDRADKVHELVGGGRVQKVLMQPLPARRVAAAREKVFF